MNCERCKGTGFVDYAGFSIDLCDLCQWAKDDCPEGVSGKPKEVAALIFQHRAALAVIREAVALYGKPGGPWSVPGDPGGWLSRARATLGDLPDFGECVAYSDLLSVARQGLAIMERLRAGDAPTSAAIRSFSDNARAAIAAAMGEQ